MSDIIKLAIGVPAYGGSITAEQSKMWLEFGSTLGFSHERFALVMHGFADINGVDRARNFLLANAMMRGADWLFMIDADTWVAGEDSADAGFQVLRMISEADRAGAALVSAAVLRRATKDTSATRELAVYNHNALSSRRSKLDPIQAMPWKMADGFDAVGAACIGINLHKIGESTFKFTDELSEDLEFCRQIKQLGGKILVDGRVNTGHLSRPFPLYREKD